MLLVGCRIITVNEANDWISTNRFITKLLPARNRYFSLLLKKKETYHKAFRAVNSSFSRIEEHYGERRIESHLICFTLH